MQSVQCSWLASLFIPLQLVSMRYFVVLYIVCTFVACTLCVRSRNVCDWVMAYKSTSHLHHCQIYDSKNESFVYLLSMFKRLFGRDAYAPEIRLFNTSICNRPIVPSLFGKLFDSPKNAGELIGVVIWQQCDKIFVIIAVINGPSWKNCIQCPTQHTPNWILQPKNNNK